MRRAEIAETRVYESWLDYQEALKRAIAPLREEQLQRRLAPGLRTPGEIATHIVFGRAKWVHHVLGERAAELVSNAARECTKDRRPMGTRDSRPVGTSSESPTSLMNT
jgi:hypothetical protein